MDGSEFGVEDFGIIVLCCVQQFPSACESVENGVFFGERFVEDSGAKLSWST